MVDSLSRSVNFDLVEKPGMGTNDISSAGIRRSLSSVPLGMNVGEWVLRSRDSPRRGRLVDDSTARRSVCRVMLFV